MVIVNGDPAPARFAPHPFMSPRCYDAKHASCAKPFLEIPHTLRFTRPY